MNIDRLLPDHIELPAPPATLDPSLLPAHGAVYALTDQEDRFILLAAAENVRRVVLARLQPPDDLKRRRADLYAITRHIRYVGTHSQFETMYRFHRCSRELMPATYLDQIAFGPVWFAQVNPADGLPRWVCTSFPLEKTGTAVGPFAARTHCTQFIAVIEDLFDLCRYYEILQQTPDGQPCAYFEMGKCPAPCNGSIPLARYREMMAASAAFAAGDRQPFRQQLSQRMREAAEALEFERAAAIKRTLEQAGQVNAKAYRFARPIEQFNFLVIQRGIGRSRVRPFYVHRGHVTPGDEIRARDLPETTPEWIRRAASPDPSPKPTDSVYQTEEIWLVSHFLFKQDAVPGLYLPADQLPAPDDLVARVRETFRLERKQGAV